MFTRGQVLFIVAVWAVVLLMFPEVREFVLGWFVREWNSLHEAHCPDGYQWLPAIKDPATFHTQCVRILQNGSKLLYASPIPPLLK